MEEEIREAICMLDCSSSMYGKEKEVLSGFNSWLVEQKQRGEDFFLTLILFCTRCEILYNHVPLQYVKKLSAYTYYVRGQTAFYDAVGDMLDFSGQLQRERREDFRERTVLLLFGDGLDNASVRCSEQDILQALEEKRTAGWEIIREKTDIRRGLAQVSQALGETDT